MLELVLVFYWCAKVHNAQPCWSNINVTIFSTEIYSFIDKRKSSKSSQMEVSAFPFCFPTCSLPQSTCYNSAHYSKLFVHTNIFIFPKYFGLTNYRTKPYGACGLGNNSEQFCWRRWGSLLPGLCMLDPQPSPQSTPVEIFWRTCLQSRLQTSPPTPHKSYPKFRNHRTTFENTPLVPPKLA